MAVTSTSLPFLHRPFLKLDSFASQPSLSAPNSFSDAISSNLRLSLSASKPSRPVIAVATSPKSQAIGIHTPFRHRRQKFGFGKESKCTNFASLLASTLSSVVKLRPNTYTGHDTDTDTSVTRIIIPENGNS